MLQSRLKARKPVLASCHDTNGGFDEGAARYDYCSPWLEWHGSEQKHYRHYVSDCCHYAVLSFAKRLARREDAICNCHLFVMVF